MQQSTRWFSDGISNTPNLIAHGLGASRIIAYFLCLIFVSFAVAFGFLGVPYISFRYILEHTRQGTTLRKCEKQKEHSIERVLKGNDKIDLEPARQWSHWSSFHRMWEGAIDHGIIRHLGPRCFGSDYGFHIPGRWTLGGRAYSHLTRHMFVTPAGRDIGQDRRTATASVVIKCSFVADSR